MMPPPDDARLEALLRQAPPLLPDNGFSHLVLSALPPRLDARVSRRRSRLITLGSIIGYFIAFPHLNPWPSLLILLNQFDYAIVAPFSNPFLSLSFAIVGISFFFAFFSNETENSRF